MPIWISMSISKLVSMSMFLEGRLVMFSVDVMLKVGVAWETTVANESVQIRADGSGVAHDAPEALQHAHLDAARMLGWHSRGGGIVTQKGEARNVLFGQDEQSQLSSRSPLLVAQVGGLSFKRKLL